MAAEVGQVAEAEAAVGAPARRAVREFRTRTHVWIVVAAVAFSVAAAEIFGRRYSFFDMRIYHGAVEWWTAGGDLYEFIAPNTELGFTYPPFAALAMLPMAGMPAPAAGWVNVIVSVVALAAVLAVLLPPIADRLGWPRWLAVAAALPLALALEPGRETLGFGQVNLLLFGLVLADLVALRFRNTPAAPTAGRERPAGVQTTDSSWGAVARVAGQGLRRFWFSGAWAGAGIGLATAIKLTPGLFILYLVVSRQWRAAAVAAGTAAGATVAALLIAPRETMTYFTNVLWQTDRVGNADFTPNQSLAGILARLHDQHDAPALLWISFAAVCCALGLIRATNAHREGDELAAFTLVGLTAVVISPISWSHHLVFVIPAIIILGDAALRRRTASPGLGAVTAPSGVRHAVAAISVYLVFLVSPIWWVRHHAAPAVSHYDSGMWGVLAENSLALGVILLVAAMPWRPGAEPAYPARRPALAGRSWV